MARTDPNSDDRGLKELVIKIVHARRRATRLSPSWIATEAIAKAGATKRDQKKKPLFFKAAHLQFRQIAREVCRSMFETSESEGAQHEAFPKLQARYPVAHCGGDEPEYAKLEDLSDEDIAYNIRRMEREIKSKQDHLDAFKAWAAERKDNDRKSVAGQDR